jgi:hypothetical protein
MYHYIEYQTLANPKLRLVRKADNKVWDNVNGVLSAAPVYANTAITLTKNTTINGIPITLPSTLPAGEYDMLLYDVASPTNTDEVVIGKRIQWTGKSLLGLPQDM